MCPLLSSCGTTFIYGSKYITGLIIQLHLVKIYHPFCSQKGYVHMEILVSFSLLKILSFPNSKVGPTTFLCESLWSWRICQGFVSSFVYHLSVCFMHSIIIELWHMKGMLCPKTSLKKTACKNPHANVFSGGGMVVVAVETSLCNQDRGQCHGNEITLLVLLNYQLSSISVIL